MMRLYPATMSRQSLGTLTCDVRDRSNAKPIETFQKVFRLPPSGIVDYPTWYKLSDIYVAVTRLN